MGLPASWTCFLSPIHYAVAVTVDPDHNFRIKGDDIIALWTPKMIGEFKQLASTVGLIVNDKGGEGPKYGTFCEGDYLLRYDNLLQRLPTYSLKSFVNNQLLSLEQLDSFLARGVSRKRLNFLQHRYHKRWIDAARKYGVDRYAPNQLGGLGLLSKKPENLTMLSGQSQMMMFALHNGKLSVDTGFEEFKAGAAPARGRNVDLVTTRSLGIKWTCSVGQADKALVTAVTSKLSSAIADASFMDALEGRFHESAPPTINAIVKRLRKTVRHTTKQLVATDRISCDLATARKLLARATPTKKSVRSSFDLQGDKILLPLVEESDFSVNPRIQGDKSIVPRRAGIGAASFLQRRNAVSLRIPLDLSMRSGPESVERDSARTQAPS